MGRQFSGSSQYYEYAGAQVTGTPLTMAVWAYSHGYDGTYGNAALALCDASNAAGELFTIGRHTDGTMRCTTLDGGTSYYSDSSMSDNTLYHICGVYASDSSRLLYKDGVAQTEETTATTITGIDVTCISTLAYSNTHNGEWDGDLFEAAIWNVALTAAEVAVLAAGFSPLFVRPQNLVHYLPLVRDVVDVVGGYTFSATGSPTVVAHAPIYYPAPPFISFPTAAGGTTEIIASGTESLSGAIVFGNLNSVIIAEASSLSGSNIFGNLNSSINSGTSSLTGNTIFGNLLSKINSGTSSLTGSPFSALTDVLKSIGSGTLTLTGAPAFFNRLIKIAANTLSATGSVLQANILIPLVSQTLSISGGAVTAIIGIIEKISKGTLTLAGASLKAAQTVVIGAGALTLTGINFLVKFITKLISGTLSITGQTVSTFLNITKTIGSGTFTFIGRNFSISGAAKRVLMRLFDFFG